MTSTSLTNSMEHSGVTFRPIYVSLEPPAPPREYLSEYGNCLSVSDAVEITGLSAQTIRAELEAGTIPANRIGRTWVIPKAAFIAFLYGRAD